MCCSRKPIIPDLWFVWTSFHHRVASCITCDYDDDDDDDDDELVTLRDCQEKESDQLQEQHSLLEQEAASSRDRDDELTAKNRKLDKKIDSYKRELKQAKDDVSTLKSQLQQTRQDKVVIIGGARDSESGLVHRCCPSVCLSVCLSPKCKKRDFLN